MSLASARVAKRFACMRLGKDVVSTAPAAAVMGSGGSISSVALRFAAAARAVDLKALRVVGQELVASGHVVSKLRALPLSHRGWALGAWRWLEGSLHGSSLRRSEIAAVASCLHVEQLREAVLGLLERKMGVWLLSDGDLEVFQGLFTLQTASKSVGRRRNPLDQRP